MYQMKFNTRTTSEQCSPSNKNKSRMSFDQQRFSYRAETEMQTNYRPYPKKTFKKFVASKGIETPGMDSAIDMESDIVVSDEDEEESTLLIKKSKFRYNFDTLIGMKKILGRDVSNKRP